MDSKKKIQNAWRAAAAVATHTAVLFSLGNAIYAGASQNYIGCAIQSAVCARMAWRIAKAAGSDSAGDPPFSDLGYVDLACGVALFGELGAFGIADLAAGQSLLSQEFVPSHFISAIAYTASGVGHVAKSRSMDAFSTLLYGVSSVATVVATAVLDPKFDPEKFDPTSSAIIAVGTAKALTDLPKSQSLMPETWRLAKNMLARHVTPARIFAAAYATTTYSLFDVKPDQAIAWGVAIPYVMWVAGFLLFDREQNRPIINTARNQLAMLTAR